MQFRFVTSLGVPLWPDFDASSRKCQVSGAPTSLSSFCPCIPFEKRKVLLGAQHHIPARIIPAPALLHPESLTSVVTRPLPSSSKTSKILLRADGEPWICRTPISKATGPSKIRKGEVCNLGTKSPTKKALGERKLTAIS